ncbi:BrnA antitoxin family protein [Rhabdaerophilum sp. SD176]|uniref:BrnA antitoxin family protein n=1 Tax=Rhabdaerophilum sp. SD176 TaxID=2983548 RepID=UPI0024DF8268|nr:BrnA antitoxin family protein [Rhabdaerophilum sp. SD176]
MADTSDMTYLGKLDDTRHIVRHPDGRLEIRTSQTDWARLDALTDSDIASAVADDPDWAGLHDVDWSAVAIRPHRPKQPISIRLDPDVLEFFKAQGPGYQGRINTVLRHYIDTKRRA